jgi:hypothetical protein
MNHRSGAKENTMAIRIPVDPAPSGPDQPDPTLSGLRSGLTRRPIPLRSGLTRRPIPLRAGAPDPTAAFSASVHLSVIPGEDLLDLVGASEGVAENSSGSTQALLLIVLGEEPATESGVVALDYLNAGDDTPLDEATVLDQPLRELAYGAGARVLLGVLREKSGITETHRVRVRVREAPDAEAVFEVGP